VRQWSTSPATATCSASFEGFGTVAQGAIFTRIGASNQRQIHSGLDGHNEVITLRRTGFRSMHSDFGHQVACVSLDREGATCA
jgi:hypothetical protein